MVSARRSNPKLKDKIAPTAATTPSARYRDNLALSLDIPPLPLSASDVAYSNRLHSMNLPGSSTVDPSVGHGITFNEDDIIIAVMGPTGAGKSSFVNHAAGPGRSEAVVGHSLKSKTRAIKPVCCPHPEGRRNIVLVDTPGFDDTYLSDTQILKMIANWLKETYRKNTKLAGILYLHRISDDRITGTSLKNLAVFRDLCGDDHMKNIILVTTMWDLEDKSVGSKREEELLSKYWKHMVYLGSRTCRFRFTHESAWDILNHLNLDVPRQTREPLQIQREMVDHQKHFQETAAAKTLFRFLADEFKSAWARIRGRTRKARTGPGIASGGYRRHAGSTSSLGSWSGWSLLSTSSSSSSSYHTPSPLSPTESTSSTCSAHGRRETLLAMIQGLMLAHQMADLASVPTLKGAIGTVLQTAQMIEGMGGAHHAIGEVVEYSGYLLEEIAQSTGPGMSKDMKKTLSSFKKELRNLQSVVKKISARGTVTRFLLHDADIQVISACTTAIRAIYDKLEVRIAMDNLDSIARLEDQLTKLRDTQEALRECECGRFVIQEESRACGQPSTSQS